MLANSRTAFTPLFLLILLAACSRPTHETKGPEPSESKNSSASLSSGFDYYLLALSWAPEFCTSRASDATSSECDPSHHFGLVVHGLWPQNNDGTYPENCAPARPVAEQTVRHMLAVMPANGLIQHEWATHGTCSGLAAQDYFAAVEKAFNVVQVPPEYRAPSQTISASPSEIEQKFADANHSPRGAFRVSCSKGEFTALEICLTPDLRYRDCGSLRDCRARQVTILPVP
jgi:ribonuclease T2